MNNRTTIRAKGSSSVTNRREPHRRKKCGLWMAIAVVLFMAGAPIAFGEDVKPAARFATPPKVIRSDGKTVVSFAVDKRTDVEVSVLDA